MVTFERSTLMQGSLYFSQKFGYPLYIDYTRTQLAVFVYVCSCVGYPTYLVYFVDKNDSRRDNFPDIKGIAAL